MVAKRGIFGLVLIALVLFADCSSALALDPHEPIDQLYHSSWDAMQGITGGVNALAQTTDGYLWLGTTDGLLRFNGISFDRYQPQNGRLMANAVSALMAMPDGGLWIGFVRGGACFLRNGQIANYTEAQGFPVSEVRAFARDSTGAIWAAVTGGLARFDGQRWHTIRKDWSYPTRSAWTLFTDREGNLWVPTGTSMVVLPAGATRFRDTGIACKVVHGITQDADGTIIFDDESADRMRAVRLDANGKLIRLPDVRVPAGAPLVDRDGSLWVASDQGLMRVPVLDWRRGHHPPESYTAKQGLTSNATTEVIEDREGNIWVATEAGLDRFRHRNVTWFHLPGSNFVLTASASGEVWAGTADPSPFSFLRVQDGEAVGSGPAAVYTAFPDRDGSIWYSGPNVLMHWKNGRFIKVPMPAPVLSLSLSSPEKPPIRASSITGDDSGALWVAFGGTGEFRLKNGKWTFVPVLPDHPDWAANYAFTDDADRIWLCWSDRIAEVDQGRVSVFGAKEGLSVGPFNVVAGQHQEIWVGGESGLAVLEGDRFHTVESEEGTGFRSVTGIVVTGMQGVWLSTASGIVHIPQSEVDLVRQKPDHKVSFELFDVISDLPEPLQPSAIWASGAVEATNGMLWFATEHGAVRVDPGHIFRNPILPPVSISAVAADNRNYSVHSRPTLPPATQNVVIHYDALSLTIPERVRFRYKLDGWDRNWHDAGGRREAYFTHLTPGKYVFRVIACNNDGLWNSKGASLDFVVAPAWYQTWWFFALCLAAGAAIVWVLHHVRLRQTAKAISARFDERIAERTRIARDLHDTFLQTIQGSKMVADDALESWSDPIRTRHALEQLSSWLDRATSESRAALNSLRLSATVHNDLAEALQRACANGGLLESMSVSLSVVGDAREMHPIVRDEVFRIAFEAIRNAHAHSRGTSLAVELRYGQDLTVLVQDNGVGIDPAMTGYGKDEHFGLQGMRERATRIRGKLTIISSPGTGTRITLVVPGSIAFSNPQLGLLQSIRVVSERVIQRIRSRKR